MSEQTLKKRKQAEHEIGQKTTKKSKKEKPDRKDKGKTHSTTPTTEFHVVRTSLVVSIPPAFSGNPRGGVEELLDSMVMKLAQLWTEGKISLSSPDHISLLLHRTFNVSIPRHHIPKDEWEFEYGPAENDPEYGAVTKTDDTGGESSINKDEKDGGRWVHHLTRGELGDANGYLTFTVIGLTIANEMLSLLGSVQPDPFSDAHMVEDGPAGKASPTESELEWAEVQDQIELNGEDEDEDDLESDEEDEDTFKTLGKRTDEASAQRRLAAEEAAATKKERNRKPKQKRIIKQ
ncbi:hypothetical protein H0H93_008636 [Arthromyces matolae]|nr:hypothetical protein H0H93_008636 [Arthromyces matolae]